MDWRRIVALAVPVGVLLFALGVIVGLETQRGPNWRLELEAYVAQHTAPSETVRVQMVTKASKPWNFTAEMGAPARANGVTPTFPPQAVRCALLVRSRPSAHGPGDEEVRQVVFLVQHSDTLYQVGWLAYEGPDEPFGTDLEATLTEIGCDMELE